MKKLWRPFFYAMALLFTIIATADLQGQTCYLTRIIEADGDTISLSYDGNNHVSVLGKNSTVKTNSNGHITEIVHDEATTNSFSRATYKYDHNNNLIEYEQFTGASATPAFINKFTYNSFNQLIETQSAVGVKQNFFYGYRFFLIFFMVIEFFCIPTQQQRTPLLSKLIQVMLTAKLETRMKRLH